ncbi:hypothetical protein L2D14_06270 [Thalassospiraceae bacterium LMO-JJ14]|nr:hypothetical protein L2D14_06270 [Thalassospiraceae bacterium LMO-JJ14]
MSEQTQANGDTIPASNRKMRNVILAIVLATAALAMYASIFLRLTDNPLQ